MNGKRWSTRVIMRYALVQLPGLFVLILVLLILQRWVNIPMWLIWTIVVLSALKDVLMFPLVWRAYDRESACNANPLTGSLGTSAERLSPDGHIRVRGELWRAEVVNTDIPVNKGETVRVLGLRGLTLIVEPEEGHKKI